ncbi:MAG: lipopolysaccharide heptosyltransferase II, partial [Deltaproteobacteria bacterium]|nr:lipopolysaccharide heptosyltransferase II [Deltaproteobacteria bacterium]
MVSWLNRLSASVWPPRPTLAHRAAGGLLRPWDWLYGRLMALRVWAYGRGLRPRTEAQVPVISVGNLTLGGTGKTPLVLHLARGLLERGLRPAVLIRGYGGQVGPGPVLVSPQSSPDQVGDEALMLAGLPGLIVIAGSKRSVSAQAAAELGAGVILLDDGFQHLKLNRCLDLVLLDADRPLGNGRVFPAGPLREPVSALRRADAFILTRADDSAAADRAAELLGRLAPGRPVWTAKHALDRVEKVPAETGPAGPELDLIGRRVVVAAGVARPGAVVRAIRDLGAAEVSPVPLVDHQPYTEREINLINRLAESYEADLVVTTAKDWPKLAPWADDLIRPLGLAKLSIRLDDPAGLWRLVEEAAAGRGRISGVIERAARPLPDQGQMVVRMPNWIGDAVMATPFLTNLRQALPRWRISLLAHAWTAPLFKADPRVDRLIVYQPQGAHQGLAGRRRLARELAGRFQAGLLLTNSLDSGLVFKMAGLKRRIGFATDCRRLLLTDPLPGSRQLSRGHQVEYYLALLTFLGLASPQRKPQVFDSPKARAWAGQWLKEQGLGPGQFLLGLAPGAAFGPAKRWPANRFAQAAKTLTQSRGGRVMIFGSAQDRDLGREAAQIVGPTAVDLTGQTSLDQAAALIGQLDLMLTNDSGLMHLADGLDRPLVALFGPTDPARNGPRGGRAAVLRAKPECAPCFKRICPKGRTCLEDIPVEEVVEAARKLL